MFEQSMLLSSAPGKKAGALAVSLSAQTLAIGTLLLIPLLYTDQLPFAQLQIPTFLPPPPPRPLEIELAPSKPITVTSDIQSAKLLRKVIPVYPKFAIIARVSGTVHLIGTIGKDGMIEQVQVVSGPSLLVEAAVDAVRQWVYRPTILNSKPMDVIAPIDVIFSLSQ